MNNNKQSQNCFYITNYYIFFQKNKEVIQCFQNSEPLNLNETHFEW